MTSDISPDSEQTILAALEQNLWQLWSRFGLGEGCVLHDDGDAIYFDTPIPSLPYNAVIRFAPEGDAARRIDDIFAHYERRKQPFVWMVHPSAQPDDLAHRLDAHGLAEAEVCPGMAMPLSGLPEEAPLPHGLSIHEVTDGAELADFLELVSWRWDIAAKHRPALASVTRALNLGAGGAIRCWIARHDGRAVAKIVLNMAAGAAGIYGVATKPEARGLGLARALTLRALHQARREGYDLAVLHSTPMAQSLYEKIGFRTYRSFRIFAPPGALHL